MDFFTGVTKVIHALGFEQFAEIAHPKNKNILVIVDPQVDFHPGGSLAVSGANEDSARVAAMIRKHTHDLDEIYVTLDSHHRNHIAHGIFWKNAAGECPAPFTLITYDDIKSEKWVPRNHHHVQHCLRYTKFLEESGKYTLCIWPEHCLIGSPGHCVVPDLHAALQEWSGITGKSVHYVHKGQNNLTEMYSAIKADYEMTNDLATMRNPDLQAELQDTQRLLVCGEALSHCVNFTFCDILETWPVGYHHRLVLLTDASSSVANFEQQGAAFLAKIQAAGCTLATTADVFVIPPPLEVPPVDAAAVAAVEKAAVTEPIKSEGEATETVAASAGEEAVVEENKTEESH
jgi:nicotinamidase-related amidase